jgi:hypothetical protein
MTDWIEIKTDLDFSQYDPISTNNSLHIYEEQYEIDGNKYRLLYIIGGDNKPIIETLINYTNESH